MGTKKPVNPGKRFKLLGFHKSSAHYGKAHTERLIGKEFVSGEEFEWYGKYGAFCGDFYPADQPGNPDYWIYAKVFLKWLD